MNAAGKILTRVDREKRTMALKRNARDIIEAVIENMRANVEPLMYSVLAPSRYIVYLHPTEFERLEGIVPEIRDECMRGLTEALEKMNRQSSLKRLVSRLSKQPGPVARPAGHSWDVTVMPDADGELEEGAILIDSILMLPARPDLGVGERTRRIRTMRIGGHTSVETSTQPAPSGSTSAAATPVSRVHARLTYTDASGAQTYEMKKDMISIGRGGRALPVDIRIQSSEDVSREHARIRRDTKSGQFFLVDLSKLGTTVNGQTVPKGYELDGVTKRENSAETALPDECQIGLADTITITFSRVG